MVVRDGVAASEPDTVSITAASADTVIDLLGVVCPDPGFGEPLLLDGRAPSLLLYSKTKRAGVPSNFGLIDGNRKYMVDQITGKIYEMGWDDAIVRELDGSEKTYFFTLLYRLMAARGLVRA